jgi:hypothetical protein
LIPLLAGLVDDAGLFPPTSLAMADAVARHRRSNSPMLSRRFLVPADRVQELLDLLGDDEKLDVHLIGGLKDPGDPRLTVRAVEIREAVPTEFPCYVEGVAPKDLEGLGYFGKVRCNDISVDDLALYVAWAARCSVPFKATAGMHEAVRHGESHGFLNLLVATSRALSGGAIADALACTSGAELAAEARELSADQVLATRWLLHSYGSCDTERPITDARELGLL